MMFDACLDVFVLSKVLLTLLLWLFSGFFIMEFDHDPGCMAAETFDEM